MQEFSGEVESDQPPIIGRAEWHPTVTVPTPASTRLIGALKSVTLWWWTAATLQLISFVSRHFISHPDAIGLWPVMLGIVGVVGSMFIPPPGSEAPRRIARLLDLPTTGHQFPARIKLKNNRRRSGEACGVVTFAEGWLSFASPEVTFSIRYQDVMICQETVNDRDYRFVFHDGLRMKLSVFGNILVGTERVKFSATDFKDRIREWRAAKPDGHSILPPNTARR